VTVYEQDSFDLRLEWGLDGVGALAGCAVLIVVDVLSFTTTVDIALGRGGRVLPLPWRDERAVEAARAAGATLTTSGLAGIERQAGLRADPGSGHGWTLRPSSLVDLPAGTFLAISSPNGATLSAAAAKTGATVLAGCLRNASAVAAAAAELAGDRPIGILPAGERWRETPGPRLRPGIEELLGAGAIAAAVPGRRAPSAEAELAGMTYRAAGPRVPELVTASVSGRELIEAGVPDDVALASAVDTSDIVPMLTDGVFAAR
jgi:2-phosphosulfolactate phosphatase